jgi:hypothetical protein
MTYTNVPPWVAGHPVIPDTLANIQFPPSTSVKVLVKYSLCGSWAPYLRCRPCVERSLAITFVIAARLTSLSLGASTSVAVHRRHNENERLRVGSSHTLL